MRIPLTEIWNFLELDLSAHQFLYTLSAGSTVVTPATLATVEALKNDPHYDPELLPSIFTFREILWQPDVISDAGKCLTAVRILGAYCQEVADSYAELECTTGSIYIALLAGLQECCVRAEQALEAEGRQSVNDVLSKFRLEAFPIIRFFICHPGNRPDYYLDATKRLNFAVKVMLTEFQGRYDQLDEPYWKLTSVVTAVTTDSPVNPQKEEEER